MEKIYRVEGMHCAACGAGVERVLKQEKNILDARVNLLLNQVLITFEKETFAEWKSACKQAGYTLVRGPSSRKLTLDIDGLHCASCVATIENSLQKMSGITRVSVHLLLKQASIEYDPQLVKTYAILDAIKKTGFDAKIHEQQIKEVKPKKHYKVFIALALGFLLLYIGMSHMLGNFKLPLPLIIDGAIYPIHFAGIQFLLASAIMIMGAAFYRNGILALWHRHPNMDTLVAIGTLSAYIYSIYNFSKLILGDEMMMHSLYFESAGVVVAFIMFGKYLEEVSKQRSTSAIQALLNLRPNTLTLLVDDEEIVVSSDEVSVHDIIVVQPGESIGVDGEIVHGVSNVNESMLSGESVPRRKEVGDPVIQGTMNLDGKILVRCLKANEETTLQQIISLVEEAQSKKANLARIADHISLYFVPVVMAIAFLAALIWFLVRNDVGFSLNIFVSVLIIACPCALGLATPTAIMVGSGKASEAQIFMKSGEALENAYKLNCMIFDKTGTLTKGEVQIVDHYAQDVEKLFQIAATLESGSKHPFATAILKKYKGKRVAGQHVIKTANGRGLFVEIASHVYRIGSQRFMVEETVDVNEYLKQESAYLDNGYSVVWVSMNREVIGLIALFDPLKENVVQIIQQLKQRKIKVVLMSGDHEKVVNKIAKKAGIDEAISQVLPHQKGEHVQALQKQGFQVGMVGDGINDAIALSVANVGIAIGSGSDIALEAGHIVLMRDDLADVLYAMDISKAVVRNIHQNLFWAFFYNVLGIPIAAGVWYAFGGILLSPIFAGAAMAFSSVSVVCNALRLKNFKKT